MNLASSGERLLFIFDFVICGKISADVESAGQTRFNINPQPQQIKNPAISTATTVEPTGVPVSIAVKMPVTAHSTEKTAEKIITAR